MRTEKRRKQIEHPFPDRILTRSGRESEDGVPLLLWRAEFPAAAAPETPDAASFYAALADRTVTYLTGGLADLLRAAYLRSDPARRRFTFRCAVYRHEVTIERVGETATVRRTVTLTQAGKPIVCRVFRETWDAGDGSLLYTEGDGESPRSRPEKPAKKSRKRLTSAHAM